jgi:hypothetical protein
MYYETMRTAIHLNETKGKRNGVNYLSYMADNRSKRGRPRKEDYLSETVYEYAKKGKKLAKQARERDKASNEKTGHGFLLLAFIAIYLIIGRLFA